MGSISFKLMSLKDCALGGKRLPNMENILSLKMGTDLLGGDTDMVHGTNMAMKADVD